MKKSLFDFILLALVGIFIVVPLIYFLSSSILGFNISSLSQTFFLVLTRSWVWSLLQSFLSAFLVTTISVVLTLSLLLLKTRSQRIFSSLFSSVGILYFVLPGTALSLILLSLPFNISQHLGGWPLIILAHTMWSLLLMSHILYIKTSSWLWADGYALIQSAQTLGANSKQVLMSTLLPFLKTELREIFVLVFVWSFGAFSTVFLLGKGPQHSSLEVMLFYTLFNDLDSTRLLFVVLLNTITQGWVLKKFYMNLKFVPNAAPPSQRPFTEIGNLGLSNNLKLFSPILVMIFVGLLLNHVMGFMSVFKQPELSQILESTLFSFQFGVITCLICGFFAFLLIGSHSQSRRWILFLFSLSPMVLAASWSSFKQDNAPFVESNLFLASMALALTQIPIISLWIDSHLSSLDTSYEEYLDSLGLSYFEKVIRFRVPLLKSLIIQILIFIFSLALGDLVMSSVFAPNTPLLAQLARKLSQSYHFESSSWVLVITVLVTLLWALLVKRAGRLLR